MQIRIRRDTLTDRLEELVFKADSFEDTREMERVYGVLMESYEVLRREDGWLPSGRGAPGYDRLEPVSVQIEGRAADGLVWSVVLGLFVSGFVLGFALRGLGG